jgi:hypothetical protein
MLRDGSMIEALQLENLVNQNRLMPSIASPADRGSAVSTSPVRTRGVSAPFGDHNLLQARHG